jgi:hypothetical protein
MSPLGGGAADVAALTEYGEATPADRSVFGSAGRLRGTIAFRPDRAGDRHA